MDIFVYPPPASNLFPVSGKLFNNYTSATWVEKFTEPSEFVIVGPLDSDIRNELPIGSFISHIGSDIVCVIENHEIVIDEDPDIQDSVIVSGRGVETFLENRYVGTNRVWNFNTADVPPYSIAGGYACTQARKLIADHIDAQVLIDDSDALPTTNVWLAPEVSPAFGTLAQPGESIFERGTVYEEAKKLLGLDNLGIVTRRPRPNVILDDGRDAPSRYEPNSFTICIYPGRNRTKAVTFSHAMGDIKKANYLFSNKDLKTTCYVYSRYFSVVTHLPYSGYNRRAMVLEAKDLDEQYDYTPSGPERDRIMAAMQVRGQMALANQNFVAISNVELDDKDFIYTYRQHYGLGDLVSVHGDYQASTTLQVTEHVEIQDETGYKAYPTLSEPPEGGYFAPA
jgi:hypothetical protein